jgi:hypothetical protein
VVTEQEKSKRAAGRAKRAQAQTAGRTNAFQALLLGHRQEPSLPSVLPAPPFTTLPSSQSSLSSPSSQSSPSSFSSPSSSSVLDRERRDCPAHPAAVAELDDEDQVPEAETDVGGVMSRYLQAVHIRLQAETSKN